MDDLIPEILDGYIALAYEMVIRKLREPNNDGNGSINYIATLDGLYLSIYVGFKNVQKQSFVGKRALHEDFHQVFDQFHALWEESDTGIIKQKGTFKHGNIEILIGIHLETPPHHLPDRVYLRSGKSVNLDKDQPETDVTKYPPRDRDAVDGHSQFAFIGSKKQSVVSSSGTVGSPKKQSSPRQREPSERPTVSLGPIPSPNSAPSQGEFRFNIPSATPAFVFGTEDSAKSSLKDFWGNPKK